MTLKNKKNEVNLKEDKGKNKIAIIALIVATFGGVPGIFSIVNYFATNRVIFGYSPKASIYGKFNSGDGDDIHILLVGTVTNKGKKSLNTRRYDCEAEVNGEWVLLRRAVIPKKSKDFNFGTEEYDVTIENVAENDLQEWNKPITSDEPTRGNLLFYSNELDLEFIKSVDKKFRLTCTDIYNEKYVKTFTSSRGPIDRSTRILKHGVSITPKEKQE